MAHQRDGGVAILFGLALVPVVAMAGAAIDYSSLTADRADLQRAADAAAIATARAYREGGSAPPGDAALDDLAERIVAANVPETALAIDGVSHRLENEIHVVEIDGRRHGVFASLVGVGEQRLAVRADATFDQVGAPAEIAIVMDVTNSMRFANRWRDATSTIAAALERLKGSEGAFYVSLVPFSDRVNVSSVVDRATWLTGESPGPSWKGCVEPRSETIGAYPHALDDDAPGPGSRFLATTKENMPEVHVASDEGRGKLPKCPSAPIVAPTTSIDTIEDALEDLKSTGTGRFDEGLAWGWRLVSPRWTAQWNVAAYPAPYGEREKIVMLFTDGQSTAYDQEVLSGPDEARRSADGRTRFSHNRGSPVGFAHLVDLCTRMKTAGVRIVMMQLEGNDDFTPYARACASSPQDHFEVDGLTSLQAALAGIGLASSGDVRLVR